MTLNDLPGIKKALKDYPKENVNVFINYLNELGTEKKKGTNGLKFYDFSRMTAESVVNLFKKVAKDGMYIDGDHITIAFKGKPSAQYDYQAYKNKMLMVYPESQIDVQLVKKEDEFSFSKRDGRIRYTHEIVNPFSQITPENLAGAYCIIKNDRGEFLELLGPADIEKMKKVANTQNVWDAWYDRMVRKSVIKRACKSHFDDITGHMDSIDNDNYDLSKLDDVKAPDSILDHINTFTDLDELLSWAAGNENSLYHKDKDFRSAVAKKKVELEQDADPEEKKPQKTKK
jgi:recombinational DNA repair protein RecT